MKPCVRPAWRQIFNGVRRKKAQFPSPLQAAGLSNGVKGVMSVAYVITEECVACGTCSEECPAEAIEEGEPYVINEEKCTECGSCFEVCPVEAIVEK
jgi:ferredoxin